MICHESGRTEINHQNCMISYRRSWVFSHVADEVVSKVQLLQLAVVHPAHQHRRNHRRPTCPRAGWISMLLLEWLPRYGAQGSHPAQGLTASTAWCPAVAPATPSHSTPRPPEGALGTPPGPGGVSAMPPRTVAPPGPRAVDSKDADQLTRRALPPLVEWHVRRTVAGAAKEVAPAGQRGGRGRRSERPNRAGGGPSAKRS